MAMKVGHRLGKDERQFLKFMKEKSGMREEDAYKSVSKTSRTVRRNETIAERQAAIKKEEMKEQNFKESFSKLRSGQ